MSNKKSKEKLDQALLDGIDGVLVVGDGRVALHGKSVTVDAHKRAPPGKGSLAPFSGGNGACTSQCKNCGKRPMGSGKCAAHSEAPAQSPKSKKRHRSPERTCHGGDGSKDHPILLDSPGWPRDYKDMKKMLAIWLD